MLFSLNLSHPLFGTLVKPLLSALTYRKPSIDSGINLCSLNYPPIDAILSYVPSTPVSFMTLHYSSPKTINSGIAQGSILTPTLFLLFINDLQNLIQCLIHSFADDTTLHFSTWYNRRPTQQELSVSR